MLAIRVAPILSDGSYGTWSTLSDRMDLATGEIVNTGPSEAPEIDPYGNEITFRWTAETGAVSYDLRLKGRFNDSTPIWNSTINLPDATSTQHTLTRGCGIPAADTMVAWVRAVYADGSKTQWIARSTASSLSVLSDEPQLVMQAGGVLRLSYSFPNRASMSGYRLRLYGRASPNDPWALRRSLAFTSVPLGGSYTFQAPPNRNTYLSSDTQVYATVEHKIGGSYASPVPAPCMAVNTGS